MKSIITDDLEHCYICDRPRDHIHHIFYGTANRKQSDKYNLVIPLCYSCHNSSNNGIHFNKALDLAIKKVAQKRFEEIYSHSEFMAVFGRNYL